MSSSLRRGFTLVEVLIVVVTMAILAAVAIPRFTEHAAATKHSVAQFSLRELRKQIELYRQHHDGRVPSETLIELTVRTNAAGIAGTTDLFPFGPYCREIPVNPVTGSDVVRRATSHPPTAATGGDDAGWLYHPATGGIWVDNAELLTE